MITISNEFLGTNKCHVTVAPVQREPALLPLLLWNPLEEKGWGEEAFLKLNAVTHTTPRRSSIATSRTVGNAPQQPRVRAGFEQVLV